MKIIKLCGPWIWNGAVYLREYYTGTGASAKIHILSNHLVNPIEYSCYIADGGQWQIVEKRFDLADAKLHCDERLIQLEWKLTNSQEEFNKFKNMM